MVEGRHRHLGACPAEEGWSRRRHLLNLSVPVDLVAVGDFLLEGVVLDRGLPDDRGMVL